MRNVLVTGGSRGIGLAIVRRLSAAGYGVVATARRESDELAAAIAAAEVAGAGPIRFRALDMNEIAAIPAFVRDLRKEVGALYGLVNNAGIGTEGVLATMYESQIAELLRVNVEAPIVLTKYVVRHMLAAGEGRIVNMGSIIGSTGYHALSVYGATKAALEGFSRSLSREVGRMGITVNVVAPGFVETELTRGLGEDGRAKIAGRSALRRLPEPDDIARTVEFLLGDGGRNITGTVLTVDAGNTA
ncbi:SDR family NAD(P)-dependent oxidoreductase [Prosthecodimorpha staleyi]|uniref:SDR family NAD(P)-dependent oxidoreductase n=1 Tax=Prosthecodimorpha staleyi TaxID=2840188 RepID=A0A947D685_9HYPH|nr:SDR family NAD(P)-dependent oxidoreductase [Prosthecodimorpha staleyi]MBT9290336.1 SDR family NAD(P)-dependent oxidoreductase [Prosthecodimorpha staleyi]